LLNTTASVATPKESRRFRESENLTIRRTSLRDLRHRHKQIDSDPREVSQNLE
jgi:hypothetical protein